MTTAHVVDTVALDEVLTIAKQQYEAVFNDKIIPMLAEMDGFTPNAKVVATVTIVDNKLAVSLALDYVDKFPDPFEYMQRIKFAMLFEASMENIS